MGTARGSIATALKNTRVVTTALMVVIGVSAVLLGLDKLSAGWTVAAQVASAVAGAALGNFLRLDISNHVVRNQARPATRHLFDRVSRLRAAVVVAETYESHVRELESRNVSLDHGRVADWFGFIGDGMRAEIDATATAIENWGDLAADVVDAEARSYESRLSRLPNKVTKEDEQ